MVNLKVLNAIANAKQAAITEDVYNLICREADTKYRYNIDQYGPMGENYFRFFIKEVGPNE